MKFNKLFLFFLIFLNLNNVKPASKQNGKNNDSVVILMQNKSKNKKDLEFEVNNAKLEKNGNEAEFDIDDENLIKLAKKNNVILENLKAELETDFLNVCLNYKEYRLIVKMIDRIEDKHAKIAWYEKNAKLHIPIFMFKLAELYSYYAKRFFNLASKNLNDQDLLKYSKEYLYKALYNYYLAETILNFDKQFLTISDLYLTEYDLFVKRSWDNIVKNLNDLKKNDVLYKQIAKDSANEALNYFTNLNIANDAARFLNCIFINRDSNQFSINQENSNQLKLNIINKYKALLLSKHSSLDNTGNKILENEISDATSKNNFDNLKDQTNKVSNANKAQIDLNKKTSSNSSSSSASLNSASSSSSSANPVNLSKNKKFRCLCSVCKNEINLSSYCRASCQQDPNKFFYYCSELCTNKHFDDHKECCNLIAEVD